MLKEQFRLHAAIEDEHWWFAGRRSILTELVHGVLAEEGRTIVEVGVGTGGNLKALVKNYDCIGVDIDAEAVRLARLRVPEARIYHGDVLRELRDIVATADGVLMLDVLEHIRDDAGFLSEIISIMKPGAYLVMTVPSRPELWSMHDTNNGHYRRYLPSSLRRLWQGSSMSEVLFSYFNARLYLAVKLVRAVNGVLGVTYGAAGTDLRMPWRWCNRILKAIFAGEGRRLRLALAGSSQHAYRIGVSLVAILRKSL